MLLDFDTRDVGLSNSMTRPMKLRCCVYNTQETIGVIFLIVVLNGYVLVNLIGAQAQSFSFNYV